MAEQALILLLLTDHGPHTPSLQDVMCDKATQMAPNLVKVLFDGQYDKGKAEDGEARESLLPIWSMGD